MCVWSGPGAPDGGGGWLEGLGGLQKLMLILSGGSVRSWDWLHGPSVLRQPSADCPRQLSMLRMDIVSFSLHVQCNFMLQRRQGLETGVQLAPMAFLTSTS